MACDPELLARTGSFYLGYLHYVCISAEIKLGELLRCFKLLASQTPFAAKRHEENQYPVKREEAMSLMIGCLHIC